MKKIRNGFANITIFCLLVSTVITVGIATTCAFQIITAPDGSIGNNIIRNVHSTIATSKKLEVKAATIGKRG